MLEAHDSRALHIVADEGRDARWMSYTELGQARGINTASAKRLALRRKWRRQAGNDGTARVAVPLHEITPRTSKALAARDEVTRLVRGLEAALSTLREQLERERSRADQATEAAERSAARLAETEAQIAKLQAAGKMALLARVSLERALTAEEAAKAKVEATLAAEQAARAKAEVDAAALRQAEQVRRALGRLARLRAAWQGE